MTIEFFLEFTILVLNLIYLPFIDRSINCGSFGVEIGVMWTFTLMRFSKILHIIRY